jgi:hypothetical protein
MCVTGRSSSNTWEPCQTSAGIDSAAGANPYSMDSAAGANPYRGAHHLHRVQSVRFSMLLDATGDRLRISAGNAVYIAAPATVTSRTVFTDSGIALSREALPMIP